MKEFKDFENEELMNELNETVEKSVTKTQAAKGEVTALVLMNLPNIYELAMNGATTAEICKRLGVNVRSFNKIKANNKQLQAVLEQAEQDMTDRVRQSLFHLTQPRVIKQQKVLSSGKIVEYEEVLQPEPSSVKYWLENKSKGEFKNKQEIEVTKRSFEIIIVDDNGEPCSEPEKHQTVEDVDYQVVEEDKK